MTKIPRILVATVLTLIAIAILTAFGYRTNMNDFVEYWSAGRLFVHGANPYSAPLILAIEKSRGFTPDAPLIMLNPPWALPLVAPLGFLPALAALILWIVAGIGCILASLRLLDVPIKDRTLAFLFAPVLGTFAMQQSSPFLLLGFALFLRLHRSSPFLAGASLVLMSIKPHLFLIFWLILLVDSLYRRRLMVLIGFASCLTAVSALVTLINPHVWQAYFDILHSSTLAQNSYPTLPSLLRERIDIYRPWIAMVPLYLAIIWSLIYYWSRRTAWDWRKDGMPVMLAALVTSPYSWISDQIVLLPSVTQALSSSRRKFVMEILIAINCIALAILSIDIRSLAWLPLALLAWYLYATWKPKNLQLDGAASPPQNQEALQS